VCLELSAGTEETQNPQDVSLIARKALSAVARVHGRFGLGAAARLLRGADDARLKRAGLDRTTTFGILGEHPDDWLQRLLRRLVTAGWVANARRGSCCRTTASISLRALRRSPRLQAGSRTAPRLNSKT
jgi:superfamily II DNA helicase RecQ